MTSELLGWLGSASVVASLIFVAVQTRHLAKQTRTSNSIGATTALHDFVEVNHGWHERLVERPELRPYFFDQRACAPNDPNRERLLTLAEMLADVLDYDLHCARMMPTVDLFLGWHHWPRHMLSHSPILREVVERSPEWWPGLSKMHRSIQNGTETASEHPLLPRSRWPRRSATERSLRSHT
jgi:hypothetical protein